MFARNMSAKRQATTDLNHENWDQEEPEEKEETGGFKMAPKEVLEKRVIRTAKRRSQATGEEAPKSVFSGFSGFNKMQKTSFDFLANLTNGNKTNNGSSTPKIDVAVVSSSSTITKSASSPSSGIFSLSGISTTPITKSAFGQSTSETTTVSGVGTIPAFTQSVFSSSKPDSTVNDSPFLGQSPLSSTPLSHFTLKSSTNLDKPMTQVSSTIFGVPSTSANITNSPFSIKTPITPFKIPVTSSPSQSGELNKALSTIVVKDEKKLIYYNNLKGLNESVLAWIKKHVEETPLCILTPIFKDYEKHLKDIHDEYHKSKESSCKNTVSDTKQSDNDAKSTVPVPGTNSVSTLFSNSTASSNSVFSLSSNKTSSAVEKTSNFTFGINTATTASPNQLSTASPNQLSTASPNQLSTASPNQLSTASPNQLSTASPNKLSATSPNQLSTAATPSTGFSFGIQSSSTSSSPFAANVTNANTTNTPFSFGIGKPFAFNSNIKKNDETAKEGEDNEDEPPKVEYTPIAEENSVYDTKCKIFVKKDDNFVDKGVGTLYIKKIEESGKYQLLVRANTSLGNVLINMILSTSIPTQRMGKNNVMMICVPTPDAKPPPTSILIRVKTSEDADNLLETLNKYKA